MIYGQGLIQKNPHQGVINDLHSDIDDNNDNVELKSEIDQWILRNKINWTAANELLAILKKSMDMKIYQIAAVPF